VITEKHIDEAIAIIEAGGRNGRGYNQGEWCGTSCCLLGWARIVAGLPELNQGPRPGEIEDTPRARKIASLMMSSGSDIIKVVKLVGKDGKIRARNADLSVANLGGANLSGADLRGAILRWVILRDAYLIDADLSRADLHRADLSRADLGGAILRDADLTDTDLSRANLRGAILRGADMCGSDMFATNTSGSVFS
jgi:hypothetical protein